MGENFFPKYRNGDYLNPVVDTPLTTSNFGSSQINSLEPFLTALLPRGKDITDVLIYLYI